MEKQTNGRSVTRSARSEHREAVKFQKEQETCMDKILHDINASGSSPNSYPDDFETISEDARARLHDKVAASRDASLKRKMSEMRKERSVRSVLRIRVVDATGDADSSVVLSWWQPSEDVVSGFSEGAFYALYNITPSNSRGSQLYLNTSRQTLVEPLPRGALPLPLRRVLTVSQVSSEAVQLGELDVVGLVVHIDGRPDRPTKTVYLADNTGYRFFGLVFWNGLQELCCEDILRVGEVVGVSNVQWRQSSVSGRIPLGYVNEVSLFALQSRSRIVQHAIDELKQRLQQEDLPSLVETCKDQIVSSLFASNFPTSNQSLEGSLNRSAVPDVNTSVNQSFGAKKEASSWSSPCATLLRPQAASTPVRSTCQKRIQFLQKFGEAPPLSPIVANVNVCRKPFKPPTRVRNDNT